MTMFGWLRKRRTAPQIPDALWRDTLQRFPFLTQRSAEDVAKLRTLAMQFLRDKEFTGAQGLTITDEMAVAIAAQAVLPVLHLGLRWYDDFVGIVVHRAEVVAQRTVTDEAGVVHRYEEVLSGEAMDRGPVMLSWNDVQAGGAAGEHGYNVVIHEFVHKLDLRDGHADGCPSLPSRTARAQWSTVMKAEFEAFREKVIVAERFGGPPTWLDPYGSEAIGEFFAVACEGYFVDRTRFGQEFPNLLGLFDDFFGPREPNTEGPRRP